MRTIGVDTGGTFTDLVLVDESGVRAEKLPSTPANPARAVLEGVAALGGAGSGTEVVHGTTVALNALLTGRVGRTALVTNEGFLDLIEIGRQDRPELYALHPEKRAPLVPRELRFEIRQRAWPDGRGGLERVAEPSALELAELARRVERAAPQSIAVCLLHSYADPSMEVRVARALEPLGLPITCSAVLLPAYREYERFSSACANAALVPLVRDYLAGLGRELGSARLSILQSNGGTTSAARAALEPARILLSGPAGGVVGASRAAREAGLDSIVTLDMGGTSTDVAFHAARARLADAAHEVRVAELPIALPSLDIHTIGCGGGSLVRVDAGGVLRVGPESAGAEPGPVCHGRGEELTVTDAHVLLGEVASGPFLGGRMELDVDAVERRFEELARKLGTQPRAAARAVLDVARAAMRRALGTMSMQRGHDPARLPLVAFGGAGGLHAAALAGALGFQGALVPRLPGCLSAFGMACADAIADRSRTLLAPLGELSERERKRVWRELAREGQAELVAAGHPARAVEHELGLDLRYRGQSYEIAIPADTPEGVAEAFHRRHAALYGWRLDEREIELVQLRARSLVRRPVPPTANARARPLPRSALRAERNVHFDRPLKCKVIDASALRPGQHFEGPALVEDYSGTTTLPPRWRARVTAGGHLWLERGRRRDRRG